MEQESKKTGTTTIGLTYKDGVVLASERKATLGHMVDSKQAQKIYELTDNIGITTAGSVGDIQSVVRYMKAEANIFKFQKGKKITVKGLTTLLANILQGNKMFPYLGQFIIGGYDKRGGQVFSLDPLGGVEKGDNFYSTGSGSPMAIGVLEDRYEEEMKEEDAVDLALSAIKSATNRDVYSGEGFAVAVIDDSGFRELEDEEIDEYFEKKK
ncbi:MAG: archaeal proteasome endopeptidase complex subunit beta [Candidatus Aenigmatarchaeota archaeon]